MAARGIALLASTACVASLLVGGAASAAAAVRPKAGISVGSAAVSPRQSDTVTLHTVGVNSGRKVLLQQQVGHHWRTMRTGTLPKSHRYSTKVAFATTGVRFVRWQVAATRAHKAVYSPVARITVRWKTSLLLRRTPTAADGYSTNYDSAAHVNGHSYSHAVTWQYNDCNSCTPSYMTWNLGRAWRSLHAVVGVEDDAPSGSSFEIEIFGDGRPLYRQRVAFGHTQAINVDVTRVLSLRVEIKPGMATAPVLASPVLSAQPSTHKRKISEPVVTYLADQTITQSDNYDLNDGTNATVDGAVLTNSLAWSYGGCNQCRDSTDDWNLGRAQSYLTGFAGIDDNSSDTNPATFTFTVDGAVVYQVKASAGTRTPFVIDVRGGLRLHVTVSVGAGHPTTAVLGDVRLLRGAKVAPAVAGSRPVYY